MSSDKKFSDFADVLRNLSKGTVDLAVKKLYDAIIKKHEKDKIKYYVNLNIEVPDNAIKEVIDTLIVQRRFFSNYYCFERYKKINVKVNEDIGKNIINVYLYAAPANPSTFNINDKCVIFDILKQEEDCFKNFFSLDDLYEKIKIIVDTFSGPFKKKQKKKIRPLIEEVTRFRKIIKCAKKYKLNVEAIFLKTLKILD